MRRLSFLLGAAMALVAAPAGATALDFERYFVCRDDDSRIVVQRDDEDDTPRDRRVKVKKRGAPARLDGEALVTIDVSVAQAPPTRRADAPPGKRTKKRVVIVESRNDWRCIGFPRGKAGLLRVVAAPPGARFWNYQDGESYRQENIVHAGLFDVRETIAPLRRILGRPLPGAIEGWEQSRLVNVKRDAAIALADMGHEKSAGKVLDFVRLLEKVHDFNYYREALDALYRLDPALSNRHAAETVEAQLAHSSEYTDYLVDELLPYVREKSPATLAFLQKLTATYGMSHRGCLIMAERIRQGDAALLAEVRPELADDLRTSLTTNCYSELVEAVAPGDDPGELDIIMKRQRWEALVNLLVNMKRAEEAGNRDPRFGEARATIKAWLLGFQGEVRNFDPTNVYYLSGYNARYLLALAHLGHEPSREKLLALIGDGQNEGTAPWVAAKRALALDIPGASEAIGKLLRVGITRTPRRFERDGWPKRGHLIVTEEGELIDELSRRGDDRYALGLLSDNGYVREVAAYHLARRKNKSACDLVGNAAKRASNDAVQFSFWALTILGKACHKKMGRLARDPKQSPEVRGMATEFLAMMRDKTAVQIAQRRGKDSLLNAAYERAELIYRSPE
jgi:hypothetical protein